jgi:L-alanine-DL-glutamate epimerase-like enolase superfamily enzyme
MSALVPKEKRHRTDLGTKVKSDATLIRVETDNGLTGIGAALGTPPIVAAMVTGPFRRVCETRRERNGKSPVSPTHIR